jgi:hypothetical protein
MSEPLIVVLGNTVVVYDRGAEILRFDHPEAEDAAMKLKDWALHLVREAALETLRVTRAT